MPAQTRKTTTLYSPHPGIAMVESSMRKLQERTGKTVDEWVKIVKRSGPPTEKERRDWLKSAHGFTTNYAWWVAELSVGKGEEHSSPEAYLEAAQGYVETMYGGKRAALRPVYDRL